MSQFWQRTRGAGVAVTETPLGRLEARRQIVCAKQLQVSRAETVALKWGIHGLCIIGEVREQPSAKPSVYWEL